MQNEIVNALRNRGNEGDFARFQDYASGRLYASAGAFTGSELTGNCRLSWYAHLLRNPLKAPAEAEEFTRLLHKSIVDDPSGLGPALATASEKLDLGRRKPRAFIPVHSPQEALDVVKQSLVGAQTAFAAALAPLNKGEIQELILNLYPALVGQNHVGHTLNDRGTGRRLCDLMEKMDRAAMLDAAEALVPVSDPKLLDQLKQFPEQGDINVEGVTGRVVAKIDTPAGAIVIGGKGGNTYQLDRMNGVAAVISLGGGNTYYEGTTSLERPVLLVVNLGGGNVFQATKPGVQGAAILGVSMLVNTEGNNRYQAEDVAQGSCLAGVGILLDYGGNNKYWGVRRVQAEALGGVGILINRGGHNDYHAAMWAQGFGSPLGFGMIENMGGYDHYYCGGLYPNSYKPETPGYEGWGQGVGGRHPPIGRRRPGRAARRRRSQRLRVRLPIPRRWLLVRHGFRPRFRRKQPAVDRPKGVLRRRAHRAALPTLRLRLGLPLLGRVLLRRPRQQHLRRQHHGQRHGLGLLGGRAVQPGRKGSLHGHPGTDPGLRGPGQPGHPLPLRR